MNFSRNAALWIIIVLLLFALFQLFQGTTSRGPQQQLAFSEFVDEVESGRVQEVTIQGQQITGQFRSGGAFQTYAPEDPNLVTQLRDNGVRIKAAPVEEVNPLLSILISWFPMLLLIARMDFLHAPDAVRRRQGHGLRQEPGAAADGEDSGG